MYYGVLYMNKKKFGISIIVLIIDQILKLLVQTFETNVSIIKNLFAISYYQNTGAAWSILEGEQLLLIIISLVMIVIVYSMMFSFEENKLTNIAFGILFGGIIGNLIDRVLFGYVRDFIAITIFGYHFPIFNIADIGIVLGVFLLIIETVKGEIKKWKLK
jgi:signal peptidase II